jgi:DNA ligase D-like protein (predicted ligase)
MDRISHRPETANPRALDRLPADLKKRLKKSEQPAWVAPMLATLTEERFSRQGWLFEEKFDGERCLVFRSGSELNLYSRNRKRLNHKYPELVEALLNQAPTNFIGDGEIVAFKKNVTSFAMLQQRMQVNHPSDGLIRRVPVRLCLFDLLYLHQYDIRHLPLSYRKELLRSVFDFRSPLRFTRHRDTEGEAYYRDACRRAWEGVIAKNAESLYVAGRSRDWLKFKCVKEQEFVIVGYTDPEGHRIGFGALLVGFYRGQDLLYAGKVGTGYDTETLKRLSTQLSRLQTKTSPVTGAELHRRGIHWVKPKLVAQIRFAEWTRDDKLRHPRFIGLRDDKRPEEVIREG